MVYFDFNVHYEPSSHQSSKASRIKLVIKAMELGYIGIAYNHTIKGVMSDHDRCSIPLLSLSTLLTHAPSLSSSVNLHRDLLNIPRATPFRQYTRLTVCVESPAQSQVLNDGNPILKTYDLIAVRPLNQSAFDHACEKAQVHIIAIDFASKLPFRLKQQMVRAAMERGVYFEITYSHLIADVQVRRQMISNAKLLVDWTGGKNLILTSAASSVTELRGPFDVANLSSLLGLSMERAKASISKNCRNLINNALRKRHFYKEAIRVELLSVDEKSSSNKPLSLDWLKWDPISSGEGDLQLDDMAKSFSATTIVSKTMEAIDFASIIENTPSSGLNFFTTTSPLEVPAPTSGFPEKPCRLDIPETVQTSLQNSPRKPQILGNVNSEELPTEGMKLFTNHEETRVSSDMAEEEARLSINVAEEETRVPMNVAEEETRIPMNVAEEETRTPMNVMEEETRTPTSMKDSNVSNTLFHLIEAERPGLQSQRGIPTCQTNLMLSNENTDIQTDNSCVVDAKIDVSLENNNLPCHKERYLTLQGSIQNVAMEEDVIGIKDQEDAPATKNIPGRDQLREVGDDIVAVVDHIPFLATPDLKIKDASSVAKHGNLKLLAVKKDLGNVDNKHVMVLNGDLEVNENPSGESCRHLDEAMVEGEKHEEAASERKFRTKQRRPLQPRLFPFKRFLNPMPFKRSKKLKKRIKMA